MLLIALTIVLLAAWYLYASGTTQEADVPTRAVLAGMGASGQIVLTCMVLGVAGWLTPATVSFVSLAVGIGLVVAAIRMGSRLGRLLAFDARRLLGGARLALGWETAALALILLFAAVWMSALIVFYPPRGVDDLVYHLPQVYQAVQDHRLEVLPLTLRKFFAFPFSAEMVFLWVSLLTHSTRWVDASQAAFVPVGMLAVFALSRRLGVTARGSALACGLFGIMPVVLTQATSNYVDVIANVWVLGAAVALLEYERSGSLAALAVGGLATGLVLGSKYQSVLFVLALTVLAGVAIRRRARRGPSFLLFAIPAAAAGSYWYVRNWLRFSNPFYPLPFTVFGVTIFQGDWPQGPSVWSKLLADPAEVFRVAVWDPGLGTFNGGLGFLFWGFTVPAVAFAAHRIFREDRWTRPGRLFVLGLVPVAFFTLFLTPYSDMSLTPRYVLAAGGPVFASLGLLIDEAASRRIGVAPVLRGVGVIAAGLALPVVAGSNRPLMSLAPVAEDTSEARSIGEMRYLRSSFWDLIPMSSCWAPLDAITREGRGLTVYQAGDFKVFWTGPTFGVDLQNRIWNFLPEGERAREPDAFFFHQPRRSPLYLGKEIHRETVAADPRYELIASERDDGTTLYVSRAALAEKDRAARLAQYYRRASASLVEATSESAAAIEPGSLLVMTFPLASGYFVHKAEGRLRGEFEPITTKELDAAATRWPHRAIYTLGATIPEMKARLVRNLEILGQTVPLVRNEPGDQPGTGTGEAPSSGGNPGAGAEP